VEIKIREINGTLLAEIISDQIVINEMQDALDIMANAGYMGSNRLILKEEQILPEFFDLKTKIAGEILQKFSTYDCYLAIVGDFSKYKSKSLNDFILESNKYRRINFVRSVDEAIQKLTEIK